MRIGILGGGQLGMMLAESLLKLGAEVEVLDPDPDSPALARLANVTTRPFDDAAALKAMFERCDVVTFDSENVPAAPLTPFAAKLLPSREVLSTTQDRILEKGFLAQHRFPLVRHQPLPAGSDVVAAAKAFGFPCILKSARGGYDGKGQYRLDDTAALAGLPHDASKHAWVLEERVVLRTELSCIVARDAKGQTECFPVFENHHAHHVLDTTVVPTRVPLELEAQAREVAVAISKALNVVGLLTVEFFVAQRAGGPALFVNELAPRTHNSGHVTRQACSFSQFDALARILLGMPISTPRLHPGAWCMGNLLGDVWLAQGRKGGALGLSAWEQFPDVADVFLYGKQEARERRKMGHFVLHADTPKRALERAAAFRRALSASAR